MIRALLLVLLMGMVSAGHACLWDRDTLAEQAKNTTDAIWVITGRFERNPPLYYEMRLARIAKELEQAPANLESYDDAGVASDRLGRSDEAIVWMQKKHAEMERQENADGDPQLLSEHRYRYLANIGTFHAHKWLRSGADREDVTDLEQARDFIREAIRLNPDAHFGREKYQLMAIEWILNPPVGPSEDTVNQMLPNFVSKNWNRGTPEEMVHGLTGLIVLGDAWGSVDVYNALAYSLRLSGKRNLSRMAGLRARELVLQGRTSLIANIPVSGLLKMLDWQPELFGDDTIFGTLRADANRWHDHRTAYMMERLNSGRHPDTDPQFWNQYTELPAPDLGPENRSAWLDPKVWLHWLLKFSIVWFLIAVIVGKRWIVRRLQRRKNPV